MSARVNAVNRTVLTLLGAFLLAAGVLGLLLSYGVFGDDRADDDVLPPDARTYAGDHPWFWWAVGAGAVVLALLGLRWLVAQLRSDRVGRLDLTQDERDGRTTVHAGAFTDAVTRDAEGVHGVAGASAALRGPGRPRLLLIADLADSADVAAIRAALEHDVVAHARQSVDDPDLLVDIELRPDSSRLPARSLR